VRPDELERRPQERLEALGSAPRAELHVIGVVDFEHADRIGEFWSYPRSRTFAELLIDCEEDRTLRAVLVGMLREPTVRPRNHASVLLVASEETEGLSKPTLINTRTSHIECPGQAHRSQAYAASVLIGVAVDTGGLIIVAASAVVAALGYVGRTIVGLNTEARAARANRRTNLLRLQALLRGSDAVFWVQIRLRSRLYHLLGENHPKELEHAEAGGMGYEYSFTQLKRQDLMTTDEQELHLLIRGYTQALKILNQAMLDWLRADSDFRNPPASSPAANNLAVELNQLDSHLTLWLAKYEVWIPSQPEHALCYTDDEERHGTEFPSGIESTVAEVLKEQGIVVPFLDPDPKRDHLLGPLSRRA
jgi:hypothetical protein